MDAESVIVVDTATLAAALGVAPSRVRKLVRKKVIAPLPKRAVTGKTGRPSMLFDLAEVEKRLAERRNLTKISEGA